MRMRSALTFVTCDSSGRPAGKASSVMDNVAVCGFLLLILATAHSDGNSTSLQATTAVSSIAAPASYSQLIRVTRTPAATQPQMCSTGPNIGKPYGGFTETSNILYIDLSVPVPCSGIIVRWNYCHLVPGFSQSPAQIWPTVWRRANDTGYSLVGKNIFSVIPGSGTDYRCGTLIPRSCERIQVEEGDYIGFYLPDSGVFVTVSTLQADPGHHQLQKRSEGFADHLNDSELISAGNQTGRAQLGAIIDVTAAVGCSSGTFGTSPSFTPNVIDLVAAVPPTLMISIITAACVIVTLLTIIGCLGGYVMFNRRKKILTPRPGLSDRSMEYNNMYIPRNPNEVLVCGRKMALDIKENRAYEEVHESQSVLLWQPVSPRRSLDHTYESISSIAVNHVNALQRQE